MIGRCFISAAALFLACCSGASSDDGMSEAVLEGAANTVTSGASEALGTATGQSVRELKTSDTFKDDYESMDSLGGMVVKLDISEVNEAGVIGAVTGKPLYVLFDPTCESCVKPGELVEGHGLDVVEVPIAYYADDGLTKVGNYLCESLKLEEGSEGCLQKSKAVAENTRYFMVQGIVDLPAIMMPSGWVIEDVSSGEDIASLLKGQEQ